MKKIAFDIGNVLIHFDITKFTDELDKIEECKNKKHGLDFISELQAFQDIGISTVRIHLGNIYPYLSKNDIDRLIFAWESTLSRNTVMDKVINKFIKNNIEIALVSNIGFEHKNFIKKFWSELYENSIHHFSCDVGARKPHKLYYQSFLMEFPEFKGCKYVDDRRENLEVGSKFGFESQYFNLDESDYLNNIKLSQIGYYQ